MISLAPLKVQHNTHQNYILDFISSFQSDQCSERFGGAKIFPYNPVYLTFIPPSDLVTVMIWLHPDIQILIASVFDFSQRLNIRLGSFEII